MQPQEQVSPQRSSSDQDFYVVSLEEDLEQQQYFAPDQAGVRVVASQAVAAQLQKEREDETRTAKSAPDGMPPVVNPNPDEEWMMCPITHQVMVDPVMEPGGYSYERDDIEKWVSQHHSSPMSRRPLTADQLKPNRALKEAIVRWKAANGDALEKLRTESAIREARANAILVRSYVQYWQRNDAAKRCTHCAAEFTISRRKHHCRCCGYIFCNNCCSCFGRIGDTENGTLERICCRCALRFATEDAEKSAKAQPEGSPPPTGAVPSLVLVPPSWSNYFHIPLVLLPAIGDATQDLTDLARQKFPIIKQWAVETGAQVAKNLSEGAQYVSKSITQTREE